MTRLSDVVFQLEGTGSGICPSATPNGICSGQDREPDMIYLIVIGLTITN